MKSRYLKTMILFILMGSCFISCEDKWNQDKNIDPTAFRAPVSKPLVFTEEQPIKWEIIDPDSIAPPKSYRFDIDKMPSEPFSINEFKPLKAPMKEYSFEWDDQQVTSIEFDTLDTEPKVSILPKPVITKADKPKLVDGTTSGLLQFSQTEGLPSHEIKSIIQNDDGTFWIATYNGGLCLYNGEFLYTYDFKNIFDIALDHQGRLGLGAQDGFYLLDFKKNIQIFYPGPLISDLYCDHRGTIWMLGWTTDVYFLDENSSHLNRITTEGFQRSMRFLEDRNQNLWIGLWGPNNTGHIRVIDKDRKGFKKIEGNEELNIGGTPYLMEDQRGNIWIDNEGNRFGAASISLANKTIRTIGVNNGYLGRAGLIEEDDRGRIWLIQQDTVTILSEDRSQIKTLVTKGTIWASRRMGYTIKDNRGKIWIGTNNRGVIIADPDGFFSENISSHQGLMDGEIWDIEEDSRGNIWLGTLTGINVYDPIKGANKTIDHSKLKTPASQGAITFIKEFEKDKFFIDGIFGFNIIDRAEKRMTRYIEDQNIATRIAEAIKDEEGTYWLATVRGLASYNPELNWLKTIPDSSTQLACNGIRSIVEDELGHYWLGTDNGLAIIDPDKNTIKHLRETEGLCNNNIFKIMRRENGQLWVATFDGIAVIDIDNQTITNLGDEEGLIPDEMYELQEKEGIVYAGSVNGLIEIKNSSDEKEPWTFKNNAMDQGLPLYDYHANAGTVLRNGQLWLPATGQSAGLTILTQDAVIDTTPCPVYITGLSIMDDNPSFESVAGLQSYFETSDTLWSPDGNHFFTSTAPPKDSGYVFENKIQWDSLTARYKLPIGLKLPYDQNYLRFSYANLCVLNKDAISYRYMLEGAENEWQYGGQETETKNYFSLSPGSYTFKVATKVSPGLWGDSTEYSFDIIPPWWQTWWAYISYIALLGFGIYGFTYYRTKQLRGQQKILEDKVEERTKELGKRLDELQVVNQISKATTSELKFDALVQLAGDEMRKSFNADIAYIAIKEQDHPMIQFPYQYGDHLAPLKFGEGLTSHIISTGESLLINEDVKGAYEKYGLQRKGVTPASYLGVPIGVGNDVFGVLSVQKIEGGQYFKQEDQNLLSTIASNVGVAIHNARLYQEAQIAKAAAEKANVAKSTFLSTVSHELRTPLTSVLGFAKIIKKRLEGRIFPLIESDDAKIHKTIGQVSENLNVVISEGERLTQLINDVLDLAKIEAGKIEWHLESIAMSDIIDRAISSTSSLFDKKNLPLRKEISDELPSLTADRNKLIQVVINLLSNAIKFTDEGEVFCKAYQHKNEIIVSVTDSGIGIAPEDQDQVFDKFKQVGDTLTDKPQGTGLGLPICKEIVEYHGGRIWVESGLGKGSTFFFSIPLERTHEEGKPVQLDDLVAQLKTQIHHAPLEQDGTEHTILVVDDDAPIRSLLRQELSEIGYKIREAENGKAALDSVREKRPDLIILDVMMPEMNGFDVAAVLKNDPNTMDIPIIILSIVEDEKRGFRIGVDRYLTKPINTEKLFTEVSGLLNQGKSKKKVLVVDEDASTVKSLVEVLHARGYTVEESNSEELLEKAKSGKPDIIILNSLLENQEMVKTLRFEKGLEHVLFYLYQ